jgi:hypothetical protein
MSKSFSLCSVATLGTLLWLAGAGLADSVKSGPQVGDKVPGPYKPYNVTGAEAGKQACLYCKNGSHPVAVVFAREITPEVAQLLKRLDAATVANEERSMGSYAVFCNSAPALVGALSQLAGQLGLQKLVLSTFSPAGPSAYQIAPEADVTVLLYNHMKVKANYAFKKGELTQAQVERICAGMPALFAE